MDPSGWPPPEARVAISRQLAAAAAEMTTSALARIADEHRWFADLDAEHRSWITLVARSGIDGFLEWFAAGGRDIAPGTKRARSTPSHSASVAFI